MSDLMKAKEGGQGMRNISGVVFVGVAISACGSQRMPGATIQITTSLASDRQLSTLSGAEAEAYCGDINVYLESQLTATQRQIGDCAASSASSALGAPGEKRGVCETSYDQCIQAPVPANSVECVAFAAQVKLCSATVSAYSQCIAAETMLLVALASEGRAVCESLPDGGAVPPLGSPPAACREMPPGCISSSSSGEGGTSRADGG